MAGLGLDNFIPVPLFQVEETLSELGIFSTILVDASTDTILRNDTRGHLLRTKPATSNEGGVAAGFAVIDSPLLV